MNALLILLTGIFFSLASLFVKGNFDPFILLGFIFIALFDFILRKQRKFVFGWLPWICGLALILTIKLFIVDIKIAQQDIPELRIFKNSRIFYQPSLFKLKTEGLFLYEPKGDSKTYFVILKNTDKNLCRVYILSNNEFKDVPRSQIKGKVFRITH